MEHRIDPHTARRLIAATRDLIYEDSRLIVNDDPAGAYLHKAIDSLADAAAYLLEVEDIEQEERRHLENLMSVVDAFGVDPK